MCADYTGAWNLLYDWQTLLAGGAAVFGGWLAYRAGVRQANETQNAARLQIEAMAKQSAILTRQNEELRRTLARETLIAARMLDASMEVVAGDIQTARSRFSGPADGHIDEPRANQIRHSVGKPGFAYLWEKVGMLDREIAVPFLELEASIDRLRAQEGATFVGGLTDKLENLSVFVERILDLAGAEIRRATVRLSGENASPR